MLKERHDRRFHFNFAYEVLKVLTMVRYKFESGISKRKRGRYQLNAVTLTQ
jgi:hypothetical protein